TRRKSVKQNCFTEERRSRRLSRADCTLVDVHILASRLTPAEILFHAVPNEPGPHFLVRPECKCSLDRRFEVVGIVLVETEACPFACHWIELADRVGKTTRCSNHGHGTVSEAIHLIEAAGFVLRRHEKDVRTCLGKMGNAVFEFES